MENPTIQKLKKEIEKIQKQQQEEQTIKDLQKKLKELENPKKTKAIEISKKLAKGTINALGKVIQNTAKEIEKQNKISEAKQNGKQKNRRNKKQNNNNKQDPSDIWERLPRII